MEQNTNCISFFFFLVRYNTMRYLSVNVCINNLLSVNLYEMLLWLLFCAKFRFSFNCISNIFALIILYGAVITLTLTPNPNPNPTEAGVPARVKEASKKGKYSILGHEIASRVVPFIVESTGRMGEEALSLVDSITKLNGPVLNPNGSLKRARNFFLNRISTSLVNANHRMLSAYLNKSDFVVSAPV